MICRPLEPTRLQKSEKPDSLESGFPNNSLTMSYFHTGIRTIIGAEAFHCPVRDGKEWDHLAMVIRHNLLPTAYCQPIQRVESDIDCANHGICDLTYQG
jgi:hypothetical protein